MNSTFSFVSAAASIKAIMALNVIGESRLILLNIIIVLLDI